MTKQSRELIDLLMSVYKDTDKVIEVLLGCFKKLKIFKPLELQLKNIKNNLMDLSGFFYFPNSVEPDLANEIVDYLNNQEWKGVTASETGRKVQQYGYEYDYASRKDKDYKKAPDIPELLLLLQYIGLNTVECLIDPKTFDMCKLNQCIVNKYEPKQGISAHIDKRTFGPAIVCFTLGSGTTIIFSRTLDGETKTIEKYVEPNSLYIMSGESRFEWKHEIKPKVTDKGIRRGTRISVTFRTVTE